MMPQGPLQLARAGHSHGRETINEGVFYLLSLPFFPVLTFGLIKGLFMVPGGQHLLYYTPDCQFSLLRPGGPRAF